MIELSCDYSQEKIKQFVAQRIGLTYGGAFDPAAAVAVLRDGSIVGGVVFNNYHPLTKGRMIEISCATDDPGCLTRGILRGIFEYPFKQLEVNRLKAECSTGNTRCRKLVERLGFQFEGVMRKGHDGEQDSAVYSMLPGECRWV